MELELEKGISLGERTKLSPPSGKIGMDPPQAKILSS
jgi:hypothetical protein